MLRSARMNSPEFPGLSWVNKFPGSRSVADLAEPFQTKVQSFIAALEAAGSDVSISATYRPPERAYLMHWCCQIAGYRDPATGELIRIDPTKVSIMPMAGVDIDWTAGGQPVFARVLCQKMRAGYQIDYPAALTSRHTQRLAIDMTIKVPAKSTIVDANGQKVRFDVSAQGTDPRVAAIGASFGVMKLASDVPHWSCDGH